MRIQQILIFAATLAFASCASIPGMPESDPEEPVVTGSDNQEIESNPAGSDSASESASVLDSASESVSESASETSTDSGCEGTMAEAFEDGAIPAGWLVEDGDSDGYTWEWKGEGNDIGGEASGGYLMVDASTAIGAALNERLVSLELESRGCSSLSLSFEQSFPRGADDQAFVEISVNGGDWQSLRQYEAASTGAQLVDLSSALSSDASFRLGFRYESSNGEYWKLDNVRILIAVE